MFINSSKKIKKNKKKTYSIYGYGDPRLLSAHTQSLVCFYQKKHYDGLAARALCCKLMVNF